MHSRTANVPSRLLRTHPDGKVDTYIVGEMIGRGGFGTVHKVMHVEKGQTFALKATPLHILDNPVVREKLKHEVELQHSLNHPNIVKAYDKFEDEFNYYIVLELCPYSSVNSLYIRHRSFTEAQAAYVLSQVLQGLIYLHERRIVHRDVKLENFLIGKNGTVKIADFGISVQLSGNDDVRHSFCGTVAYISPEMLQKTHDHGCQADMWSLGVAAFILLTGRHPFDKRNKELTYASIKSCSYKFPPEKKLSFMARDFVECLLQKNPAQRPRAADLAKHPFLALAKKSGESPLRAMLTPKTTQTEQPQSQSPDEGVIRKYTPLQKLSENTQQATNETKPTRAQHVPDYCVARYSDKVAKYGLGYMLANGCVGAIFPDKSRMIMDPFREFVQYWPDYKALRPIVTTLAGSQESKKTGILMKFWKAMASTPVSKPSERPNPNVPLHHIKYWSQTDSAILFRTDNRLYQINFRDKTKLIIFWNTKKLMSLTNIREAADVVTFESANTNKDTKQRLDQALHMIEVM